jgi:hypothetical protein
VAALLRATIHLRNAHGAVAVDAPTYAAAVAPIEAAVDDRLAVALTHGWSYDLQTRYQVHRRGLLAFLHHLDGACGPAWRIARARAGSRRMRLRRDMRRCAR